MVGMKVGRMDGSLEGKEDGTLVGALDGNTVEGKEVGLDDGCGEKG